VNEVKKIPIKEKEKKKSPFRVKEKADKLEAIINAPEKLIDGIKTYKQVCKQLGEDEFTLDDFSGVHEEDQKKSLAYLKLQQIGRLFNQGWNPNWKDNNEKKW
jgi:hypothetical protein